VTRPVDLSCKAVVEMLTDYLEKRLPGESLVLLEQHLSWCPWCDDYFEQLKHTIETTGELPGPPPSAETVEKMKAIFRSWKETKQ
jgi:predicted anti-sigma-YlaC factor YlaD